MVYLFRGTSAQLHLHRVRKSVLVIAVVSLLPVDGCVDLLDENVLLADLLDGLVLAPLDDVPSHDNLKQDGVRAVEVEDNVQLTDIAEVPVKDLDKQVNLLEGQELVGAVWKANNEVEGGVAAINHLLSGLSRDHTSHTSSPRQNQHLDAPHDPCSLARSVVGIESTVIERR